MTKQINHTILRKYTIVVMEDNETEYELPPELDIAYVIQRAHDNGDKLTADDMTGHRRMIMVADSPVEMYNHLADDVAIRMASSELGSRTLPVPTITLGVVEKPTPTPTVE